MLTPDQITTDVTTGVEAVKTAINLLLGIKKKVDAHNHEAKATQLNTGPISVAAGGLATALEQLERHDTENTARLAPPLPPAAREE